MIQNVYRQFVLLPLLVLAASLFLGACQLIIPPLGQVEEAPVEEVATAFIPALTELNEISQLQAAFNAYPDAPRLILLLSPT